MRPDTRWGAALVVFVCARAFAFNYAEHAEVYTRAQNGLSEPQRALLRDFEDAEKQALNFGTRVSPDDIPALAGDYTTDIANLINRIFLGEEDPTLRSVACPQHEERPPRAMTNCPQVPGATASTKTLTDNEWNRFHKKQLAWRRDIGVKEVDDVGPGGDLSLALIPLAIKNLSHFSVSQCEGALAPPGVFDVAHYLWVDEAVFASQSQCREVKNAVRVLVSYESAPSSYVGFHAGAMAFAAYAKRVEGDERRRAQALALLFEQFAIHYLSDLVAPGHQQCVQSHANTNWFDSVARRCNHESRNKGVVVKLREAPVCQQAAAALPDAVRAACEAGEARLYGDGKAFFSDGKPNSVTGDLAAYLATVSLQEVLDASLDEEGAAVLEGLLRTQKTERFCHLGALLRQKNADARVLALWAEGWSLGFGDPGESLVAETPEGRLIARMSKGNHRALDLVPRAPCP